MTKKILIGVAVVVVIFAALVAMQPSQYEIRRSITVAGPPAPVFAQVNDFHNWNAWSPWAKLDPQAKNSFEGATSGVGAAFAWSGNDDVGEGRMEILESTPTERIRIRLDFIRPFKDTAHTEFTFQPTGEQTVVTWIMRGKNNFIDKIFYLFMDMDKMVGGDFEKGLAAMKSIVEGGGAAAPNT